MSADATPLAATPRTEAAISQGYRFTEADGVREYVPAQLARTLEQDLAALRADLAAKEAALNEAEIQLSLAASTLNNYGHRISAEKFVFAAREARSALASRADKGGAA